MYSIIFTYGSEHIFFNYNTQEEANKKFNDFKRRVDEYTQKSIYASVIMSTTSIYGDEEECYDNFDTIR